MNTLTVNVLENTSTPVIRTGVYPHMLIAITEPAVASLSHMPRDCPASCHTWLTTSNALSIFNFIALGAKPWAKVHQTWRRPTAGTSPPSCKNFSLIAQMVYEICVTKFFTFWHRAKGKKGQKGR